MSPNLGQIWTNNRVSIQGVKSLGGIAAFFRDWAPGTLTGGTYRPGYINKGLFATCQCPQCPILEKLCNCPKGI